MSDRSDEVTTTREGDGDSGRRGQKSTDELLAETERLLAESGADEREDASGSREEAELKTESASNSEVDTDTDTDTNPSAENNGSWLSSVLSFRSKTTGKASTDAESETETTTKSRPTSAYFSPKAFLALVFTLGAGMLIASTFIPFISFVGGAIGLFGVAFLAGLVTSRRRYLEVGLAGGGLGAVMTLLSSPFFLVNSPGTFAAAGGALGLIACLVGYYFGRDLRDGLFREI